MMKLQPDAMATKNIPIAVVEDDLRLCNDLVEFLNLRNFSAQGFNSAAKLYQALLDTDFDLFLLDINLPDESGIEVMTWLRTRNQAGIIIITALTDNDTQLTCLNAGADAYLTKNATLEIIEATCLRVLSRIKPGLEPMPIAEPIPLSALKSQAWLLHKTTWHLKTPNGYQLSINQTEMIFLETLFEFTSTPISRANLLVRIGKPDTLSNRRNLDNCISRLRKKILHLSALEIPIRTNYGVGYLFAGNSRIIDHQ